MRLSGELMKRLNVSRRLLRRRSTLLCVRSFEIRLKNLKRSVKRMIDEKTLRNMERYGGSFVKTLAHLYRCADPFNKKKLEKVFKEYFEEYKNWPQGVEE